MIAPEPMNPIDLKDFKRNTYFAIPCFYDSHLHLEGLGKYSNKKNLQAIQNLKDFEIFISESQQSQLGTIEAFGLNPKLIAELGPIDDWLKAKNKMNKNYYLVLDDGHQLFVHGQFFLDFISQNKSVEKSTTSLVSYIFKDEDRSDFDAFYKKFFEQKSSTEHNLLLAQNTLLSSRVTHCRDLTSDLEQFYILQKLVKESSFKIHTDTFFSDFFGDSVDHLIKASNEARDFQKATKSHLIKHCGIKLFMDGTFSQNSVDLTCYHGSGHGQSTSNSKYKIKDLVAILEDVSMHDLEIAFHTIGDGAVDKVLMAFDQVKINFKTKIHLEHCEIISDASINYLKTLEPGFKSKLNFHFQPSHFLMDRLALMQIKERQTNCHIFAWSKLKNMGYAVFFGSDAPVTPPDLKYLKHPDFKLFFQTEAETQTFWPCFIHPDFKQYPLTFSMFRNLECENVYLQGFKA